jgi:hypothetical protein
MTDSTPVVAPGTNSESRLRSRLPAQPFIETSWVSRCLEISDHLWSTNRSSADLPDTHAYQFIFQCLGRDVRVAPTQENL